MDTLAQDAVRDPIVPRFSEAVAVLKQMDIPTVLQQVAEALTRVPADGVLLGAGNERDARTERRCRSSHTRRLSHAVVYGAAGRSRMAGRQVVEEVLQLPAEVPDAPVLALAHEMAV
jgi:hypothetical protein